MSITDSWVFFRGNLSVCLIVRGTREENGTSPEREREREREREKVEVAGRRSDVHFENQIGILSRALQTRFTLHRTKENNL